MPEKITEGKETFILAQGFRRYRPRLSGPIAVRWSRVSCQQELHWSCPLIGARYQKEKEERRKGPMNTISLLPTFFPFVLTSMLTGCSLTGVISKEKKTNLWLPVRSLEFILLFFWFFYTVSFVSAKQSTNHQPQINASSITSHPYCHRVCVCARLAAVWPDFWSSSHYRAFSTNLLLYLYSLLIGQWTFFPLSYLSPFPCHLLPWYCHKKLKVCCFLYDYLLSCVWILGSLSVLRSLLGELKFSVLWDLLYPSCPHPGLPLAFIN